MTDDSEQKLNQILGSFLADLNGSLDQSLASVVESQTDKLEQILASLQEVLTRLPPPPVPEKTGYPALYICSHSHSLYVREQRGGQLTKIIPLPESLYELFRLVTEFLQADLKMIHWVWGFVLWEEWRRKETDTPSRAFSMQCAKLRDKVERNWGLGKFLGRGGGRGHFTIPIEVEKEHFSTTALRERPGEWANNETVFAYPIWDLFMRHHVAQNAYEKQNWKEAIEKASGVLEIDPDNWLANMMVIEIAKQPNLPATIRETPAVQSACQFALRKLTSYEGAQQSIRTYAPATGKTSECEAFDTAFRLIEARLKRLRATVAWHQGSQPIAPAIPAPAAPLDPPQPIPPWRTRENYQAWYEDPTRDKGITEIGIWITGHFRGQMFVDAESAFKEYVAYLVSTDGWPLPKTETDFRWRAYEYVKIEVYHVPGRDYSEKVKNSKDIARILKAAKALDTKLAASLSPQQKQELRKMCGGWSLEKLNEVLALVRASSFTVSDMNRFAATANADTESEGDEGKAGGPVDDGDNLGRDDEGDDPNDEDKRQ